MSTDYTFDHTSFDPGAIYDRAVQEGGTDPLANVIAQAIGAASACWDNLDGAGIFMDQAAIEITDNLLAFLREQGVPRDATKNDYAEVYTESEIKAGTRRAYDKIDIRPNRG